ncbi:dimethyl sulfoxide reductase anchor subunit [Chloroflexota bacterium]
MNVREWALPVYTILMQLAVGAFIILWLIRHLVESKFSAQEIDRIISNPILVIAFTSLVAMSGAHFHLSKPFHSFLAVVNFKSSWLSREIVFSVLFLIATLTILYLTYFQTYSRKLITILGWLAILFGIILIYCMAHIYIIPTQVAWNSPTVIFSFYITTFLLGVMTIALLMVLDLKFSEIKKVNDIASRAEVIRYSFGWLTAFSVVLVVLNIAIAFIQIDFLADGDLIAQTSLSLLMELYLPLFMMRMVFLVYGAISLVYIVIRMYRFMYTPQSLMGPVYLSCLLIMVGEIIGRFLFYATHIRVGL